MSLRAELEQTIAVLELHQDALGQAAVTTAQNALRKELAQLTQSPATQQKEITVLFAHISGLSSLTYSLDTEGAYQTLNTLWRRLDRIIAEHGGQWTQRLGDSIAVLFGAYAARDNEPEWAIRTALAMQTELREFIREKTSFIEDINLAPHLQLRVGINTGMALMGPVGIQGEYTALGETITLAQTLINTAPEGSIFISERTYQYVRGVFYIQPLEPLNLRDYSAPLPIYVVRGAKPHAVRVVSRGVGGLQTPMVGRNSELEALQKTLYKTMSESRVHVCTVIGEPGLGKSRLLYEFDNWLELLPINMVYFQGRAGPQTKALPYWVFRDLFSFYFDIVGSDPTELVQQKLVQGIAEVMDGPADQIAAYIGHLIGFDFSFSPHLKTALNNPQVLHRQSIDYISQFFTALTTDGSPVVIVLEDIHWADIESLQLIEYLAQTKHNLPLLVVCPAQDSLLERYPGWGQNWPNHIQLYLHPLTEEQSAELVDSIFRRMIDTPENLRQRLVERAQGNPLFLEELVGLLIDEWVIVTGLDRWQIEPERLKKIQLPLSLAETLRARLDNLPVLERETLQRASVVGRAFWGYAVTELDENQLDDNTAKNLSAVVLDTLHNRGLIQKRDSSAFEGTDEYIFKHTLLQEVTYESIPEDVRADYHGQIAAWLIKYNGEQVDTYAALIAKHYELAQATTLAAEWYTRAGKQAQKAYAMPIALKHFQKALGMWPQFNEFAGIYQTSLQLENYGGLVTTYLWQAQQTTETDLKTEYLNNALQYAQEAENFAQKTSDAGLLSQAVALLKQTQTALKKTSG